MKTFYIIGAVCCYANVLFHLSDDTPWWSMFWFAGLMIIGSNLANL